MGRVVAVVTAGIAFLLVQWLRWPEPPGSDQSLFTFYGHWLWRGLVPYRELWDSKPPGIFALYALAERLAGTAHAPRVLDAVAAVASGLLVFALLRQHQCMESGASRRPAPEALLPRVSQLALGERLAPWAAGILAALLVNAPYFGGPHTSAQAEVLSTPLVVGALLASRRAGAPAAALAGALLGGATCLKIVPLVLLPLAWLVAPRDARWRPARAAFVLAGFSLPVLGCALWLAAHGALREGIEAVLVYPRAYSAEIASRMPLGPALARGAAGLGRGLPLVLGLAVVGVVIRPRGGLVLVALAWLALAGIGAAAQRQLVDYQIYLCVPPLAMLAGRGAGWTAALLGALWTRARAREAAALAAFTVSSLGLALVGAHEIRAWGRHYAPHVALRTGRTTRDEFLLRLGRPGLAWFEAETLVRQIAASPRDAASPPAALPAPSRETLLVWGLAPAIYALAGLPPATRYAFHQTLLVEGSPLSRRWPDARARRAELFERMRRDPPRFVVVVSGDRSGLEPRDSRAELQDFPELAGLLATRYRPLGATRSYELLERLAGAD